MIIFMREEMYKLVIFDLDGTILNTLEDLLQSCNYVLSKHDLKNIVPCSHVAASENVAGDSIC